MITYMNIIRIILVAVIVPFLIGNLVKAPDGSGKKGITDNIVYGFMLMCVLFLILAVPMIFLRTSFHLLAYVWMGVVAFACAVSLFTIIKNKGQKQFTDGLADFRKTVFSDRFTACIWMAALVIILSEAALPAVKMHVDTDDARFIAEAMEAVEKDTMLLHHAITGRYIGIVPGEQSKDITSPYPLFIALLSRLFGLHPAVTAHTVLPFLLVLLSYMVFGMAGDLLTGSDKRKTGLFLLFLSVINLFSFETIYASGYTLLTIIWQGRSICAMIMLPLLWVILMRVSVNERIVKADYFMITSAALSNTMLSNMGSILAPMLIAVYAFTYFIRRRSVKPCVLMCLCAFPSLICIVITRILRMFLERL